MKHFFSHRIKLQHLFSVLVLAVAAVALAGCSSTGKPASASFAAVDIKGQTREKITATTAAVFQEQGYTGYRAPGDTIVFEKEASRKNQIAYSSLGGGYYNEPVRERVRAEIVSLGGDSFRLQCKAFIVRQADSEFHREEIPLSNLKSRPYQKLLDQVARSLK